MTWHNMLASGEPGAACKLAARRLSSAVLFNRTRAGLTQLDLAVSAGLTVETVARLERVKRARVSANDNPTLETIVRLSLALGTTPSELLAGADPKPAAKANPRAKRIGKRS